MANTTSNSNEILKNLTNSSNGFHESPFEEWTKRQVALIITFGVIILVTILANGFILYIFGMAKRKLRNPTNMLLANLAVADLLVGFVVMPPLASLTILDSKWVLGDFMCEAFDYAHFLLCGASMWSMIGIGMDRFIGVTRPLQYKSIMTRSRTTIIIGVIWMAALTMTAGPLTYWQKPMSGITTICYINLEKYLLIFVIFFVYWIPITGAILIYYCVYKNAVAPIKKFPCKQKSDEITTKRSKHVKLAKSICALTGAIFLFYAPVFLVFTIKAFELPYFTIDMLFLGGWIRYCCSTVNPFMYGLAVPGFKQEIKERLFGIRAKRSQLEVSMTQSYVTESEGNYIY